jgi:predicted ATPase
VYATPRARQQSSDLGRTAAKCDERWPGDRRRDPELEHLTGFVDDVHSGTGVALVRGEAGIGKTTLWRMALDRAHELRLRVLTAAPTPAETSLAFVGLGDLLDEVDDEEIEQLPEPQQEALEIALLARSASAARSGAPAAIARRRARG